MSRPEFGSIIGPCSIHSYDQGFTAARRLGQYVNAVRLPPVKPRSEDSWIGMGKAALPILHDIKAKTGCTLAMEATTAKDTEWMLQVADYLWLGARHNPNNTLEIADALRGAQIGMFLVKNPLAPDIKAWIGAINVMRNRLPNCVQVAGIHRGFYERVKPSGWRNNPDFAMARKAKAETGVQMWLDPSNLIGNSALINKFLLNGGFDPTFWDGVLLEADPFPDQAKTDQNQVLSIEAALTLLSDLTQRYASTGGLLLSE